MKRLLLAILMLIAPAFAMADLIARQGEDSVRLFDVPCTSELVLPRLDPTAGPYRAASAVLNGQRFTACWRRMGPVVHLVYEDGDQGLVPVTELRQSLEL